MALEELDALCAWMRKNGVPRVRTESGLEIDFQGRTPAASIEPRETKPKTPEDIAREGKERRRAQYRLELGHDVTDEMLERLP